MSVGKSNFNATLPPQIIDLLYSELNFNTASFSPLYIFLSFGLSKLDFLIEIVLNDLSLQQELSVALV